MVMIVVGLAGGVRELGLGTDDEEPDVEAVGDEMVLIVLTENLVLSVEDV